MSETLSINNLPTPAMVLDATVIHGNIGRLAEYAALHRLRVRPHTKTHKSKHIAKLQVEHGAHGLTVAKAGEAQVMAEISNDLLLAYPATDPWRGKLMARLARESAVRIAVDSRTCVDVLSAAAQSEGSILGILVDIDVGMGRTGVQNPHAALELAQYVASAQGVQLDGIMCYPGHIWNSVMHQQQALVSVSNRLEEILDLWSLHGLEAAIISGGSTPTAYQSHFIPQLTEIRPGTYVLNDMNTLHGGFCHLEDCAARIICTVVSTAVPKQVVVDAGSKTLTSDRCIPAPESGHGFIVEYPHAKIVKLSEEHGQVDVSACENVPRIGERLTIIPNHICPCVNLQDHVWWKESDNLLRQIDIEARGKSV